MANGQTYTVPPFQRDYSWSHDEWNELWQDILESRMGSGESHYMGYLVLQSADDKQFQIIDGQQRITTLSILVLAAISHLNDLEDADGKNEQRAAQLRNSYIGYLDPVTLLPKSKLHLNRHNDNFYQSYLVPLGNIPKRGLNASNHLLRKAFDWFKEQIKRQTADSGEQVAQFIEDVVDKLFFTVITVTDELNAFKVFETLNARGVQLSSTDLLKNYLFSVVNSEKTDEKELDALARQWEGIVEQLGGGKFPEFMRTYWNSKNPLVRQSQLFKTVRSNIGNHGEVFSLLRDLDTNVRIYRDLRDADAGSWQPQDFRHIKNLQMFNVRQPLPLLLAAYNRFGESDRDTFSRILRHISILSFRYNVICNRPPNEQERLYNNVAVKISEEKLTTYNDIANSLKPLYPEDDEFKEIFAQKTLDTTSHRNKRVVRYILFELERQMGNSDPEFESDKISVEHIFPENPEDGWEHMDSVDGEQYLYRLGNMTLLETAKNKDIGNKEYAAKRVAYESSQFRLTIQTAENYSEWNRDKVNARQRWMARQACGIWQVNHQG